MGIYTYHLEAVNVLSRNDGIRVFVGVHFSDLATPYILETVTDHLMGS